MSPEIREKLSEERNESDGINHINTLDRGNNGGLSMGEKSLTREQVISALKEYPDVFESYLEAGAEKERKRIAELNAVRSECTAAIIDKALEEKKSLSDISGEIISAYKAENDRLNEKVKECEKKLAAFEPIKNQAENSQHVKTPADETKLSAMEEGIKAARTAFGIKE